MQDWAIALTLYVVSVAGCIALALWLKDRPLGKRLPESLPVAAIVVLIFLGFFGIVFLLFWYFHHKRYRDALGPPPS